MVQRSSRHLPFTFSKKYIRGPILVKLHIEHHQVWKRKGCMWLLSWLDWNSGIYRWRIMGKTLKIFSETARCLVVTYIIPAIHAHGVYTSHGVISYYWFKMGKTLRKSSLKPWNPQLVVPKILPTMHLGSKFTEYLRSLCFNGSHSHNGENFLKQIFCPQLILLICSKVCF